MEKKDVQVNTSEVGSVYTPTTDQLIANVHIAATWPTEPKPLVPSKKEQCIWAAYDTVLIILPVGLIVKTGLVILAHSRDQLNTGSNFDQATSLSRYLVSLNAQLVTLFTIVFVTIISTFVKRYALWKAQEGAYLSDLEQLQGSVSLPSTLKLIWSLGSYSTMSALLVLVWSFYYLGSQAAKDEYAATNSAPFTNQYAIVTRSDAPTSFTPEILDILDTMGDAWSGNFSTWQDESASNIRDINYQLASAILEGRKAASNGYPNLGTNSGPLIPDLESVMLKLASEPSGLTDKIVQRVSGYVDVSHQQANSEYYLNLEGVTPYIVDWAPNKTGDDPRYGPNYGLGWSTAPLLGSYTLPTSYLSIGCSDFQVLPLNAFPNGTSHNTSFSLNMTSYRSDAPRDSAGHPLREFEYWYRASLPTNMDITHSPEGGISITGGYVANYAFKAICNITTKHIDLGVSCVTTGCFPHRMRWRDDTNETAATSYSTLFDSEGFGNAFLSNLSLSTGPVNNWETDRPLIMDFMTLTQGTYYTDAPEYSPVSIQDPLNLARLFNSYLVISQKYLAEKYSSIHTATIMKEGSDAMSHSMRLEGASFERGYRIVWYWIPIDFIASSILLAAAIASWRLRVMTLAPDIFGYVSSMTRENDHVSLPTEGSMLSGMDRAKMLKRVKVKIGEVQRQAPDGQGSATVVTLAPVDTGVSGLQRERLYY